MEIELLSFKHTGQVLAARTRESAAAASVKAVAADVAGQLLFLPCETPPPTFATFQLVVTTQFIEVPTLHDEYELEVKATAYEPEHEALLAAPWQFRLESGDPVFLPTDPYVDVSITDPGAVKQAVTIKRGEAPVSATPPLIWAEQLKLLVVAKHGDLVEAWKVEMDVDEGELKLPLNAAQYPTAEVYVSAVGRRAKWARI